MPEKRNTILHWKKKKQQKNTWRTDGLYLPLKEAQDGETELSLLLRLQFVIRSLS